MPVKELNRICHFQQIVFSGDNLHEMVNPIEKISVCRLLNFDNENKSDKERGIATDKRVTVSLLTLKVLTITGADDILSDSFYMCVFFLFSFCLSLLF